MTLETSFNVFTQIDMRVGVIIDVKGFPEARNPAYQIWVDFGDEIGIKKSSAQITVHYTPSDLLNRQIIAVINFPPRQIGKFMSEILILGVPDENGDIILLSPDTKTPIGGRVI